MAYSSRLKIVADKITVDIILPVSAELVETTVYSSLECVHDQELSVVRIGGFEELFSEVEDTFTFYQAVNVIPDNHTANWAATTAYSVGNFAAPTSENDFYYKVTVAGTTAGSEPTWPVVLGNTVVDGTVTWGATTGILEEHLLRWGTKDYRIVNVIDNLYPFRSIVVKTQRSR